MSDDNKAAEAAKAEAEANARKQLDAALEAAKAVGLKIYNEDQFKEVIASRDEAKRKLREHDEAEKKAKDEKMIADGKLQELLKEREDELAQERQAKAQLAEKAGAYEAQQKALREQALGKITDPRARAIAEKLPGVADVLEFAELHIQQQKLGVDQSKGRMGAVDGTDPRKLRPGEHMEQYIARLRTEGLIKG